MPWTDEEGTLFLKTFFLKNPEGDRERPNLFHRSTFANRPHLAEFAKAHWNTWRIRIHFRPCSTEPSRQEILWWPLAHPWDN